MTEKSYPVPAAVYRTYRFPVTELGKASTVKKFSQTHMRESGGAFICAETEVKTYQLAEGVTRFFCTDTEVYAQEGRKIYMLDANVSKTGFNDLTRVIRFHDDLEREIIIALSETRTYQLKNNVPYVVAPSVGGTCMCFFRDRMFIGSGMRLNYSEALYFDKMNDFATQKSGYIDLLEDGKGNIIETIPFGDKLYLFREKGITEFTGYGDTLGFRLKEVPCGAGRIKEGSIANCGDKVYFFTDAGMFAYDGSKTSPVKTADCSRIDLDSPIFGAAVEGVYYVSAVVEGQRIFYRYDGRVEQGRYISVENEAIAARGKEIYFLWQGALYQLGTRALPPVRENCNLQFTFFPPDDKRRDGYLEAIEVTGKYLYDVTVTSENGSYSFSGNGKTRFQRPLRGEAFTVKIVPQNRMFALQEIAFYTRRDG